MGSTLHPSCSTFPPVPSQTPNHEPSERPPHPLQQDPPAHPSWSSEVLDSPHTPGPGPPDPCPCFAFLGRISLEIMTLQPRCEDVETAEGVALTVTGVAQV